MAFQSVTHKSFIDLLHLISTSSYEKEIASWSLGMADFPDDTEKPFGQAIRCG